MILLFIDYLGYKLLKKCSHSSTVYVLKLNALICQVFSIIFSSIISYFKLDVFCQQKINYGPMYIMKRKINIPDVFLRIFHIKSNIFGSSYIFVLFHIFRQLGIIIFLYLVFEPVEYFTFISSNLSVNASFYLLIYILYIYVMMKIMELQISNFDAGYEGGEETWLRDMGANISLKILQLVRFY